MAIKETINTRADLLTHTYTRVFLVQLTGETGTRDFNAAEDAAQEVRTFLENEQALVPGATIDYPSDALAIANSIQAEPFATNEDGKWRVTVIYAPESTEDLSNRTTGTTVVVGFDEDPWDRDETVSVTPLGLTQAATLNYLKDNVEDQTSGIPITNVVGQTLAIDYKISDGTLRVTVNKAYKSSDFSPQGLGGSVGKINISALTLGGESYGAKTCLLEGFVAAERIFTSGSTDTKYWEVSISYLYRPSTWVLNILNAGNREIDPKQEGASKSIYDNGQIVLRQVALDAAGVAIRDATSGRLKAPVPADEATYVKVQPYQAANIDYE